MPTAVTKNLWPLGLNAAYGTLSRRPSRVVTPIPRPGRPRRVVVGVDGSDESLTAVAWAAAEARRRDAELIVVHVWSVIPVIGYYPNGIVPRREVRHDAARTLDKAVRFAERHDVKANGTLIEGDLVDALSHAADQADLLVIGHHRHGPLVAALHRSVAARCARHARCPVVTVPSAVALPASPPPQPASTSA